jgi:hypothetical protein
MEMKTLATSVVSVLVLAVAAGAAGAASVAVSGAVTGGAALSVAGNGAPSFSLTLNGNDQTVSYTLPVEVIDPRGTGTGWNLTVTSTQFLDGAGHRFPAAASTITGTTNSCGPTSTCTTATNSVVNSNLALPAGVAAPAAVKYFNATATTGLGKVDVNATVSVLVPANVFAGTYNSTVTVSIVSGP